MGKHVKHKAAGLPKAPSWHELVQPGPKGDPKKRLARAPRRGVFVAYPPSTGTGATYRDVVLHSRKPLPTGDPRREQPRPDVARRRMIRQVRAFNAAIAESERAVA